MAFKLLLQGKEPIVLPTKYEELTFQQYRRILNAPQTTIGLVWALSGYDLQDYDKNQLNLLGDALSRLLHPIKLKPYAAIDLERRTFLEVYAFELTLKQAFDNAATQYIELLRIFDDQPDEVKVGEGFPMISKYIEDLGKLNKAWSVKMPHEPSADENSAGVGDFEYFDRWGVVYRLAGKDVTKIKQVWELPYTEVFQAALYNYTEQKYLTSMQQIQAQKIRRR